MQQLTGVDATFLYCDAPNQPMHIDYMFIFDAATSAEAFSFDSYQALLSTRLDIARTFRQRLIESPMGLDYPYWINDPDFDLSNHMHRWVLPKPGGWRELIKLHASIFGQALDRSRPLWEMHYIEGLDNVPGVAKASFAIIMKAHHAAIDAGSGAQIMNGIFDPTPQPRQFAQLPWKPDELPSSLSLLGRSALNLLKRPMKSVQAVEHAVKGAKSLVEHIGSGGDNPLPTPFVPPKTRFGGQVTPDRSWDGITCSVQEIRAVGKAYAKEITINDVVLTICAGALRAYLTEKQELPEKPLITMISVSVRKKGEENDMGNRVSALFIKLPTNEADPLKRLQMTYDSVQNAKKLYGETDSESYSGLWAGVPYLVGELATRAHHELSGKKLPGVYNVMIGNIPGPAEPLYAAGTRMHSCFVSGPPMDGVGLFITAFSYAGTLTISVASCREMMPDVEKFTGYMRDTLHELQTILIKTASSA